MPDSKSAADKLREAFQSASAGQIQPARGLDTVEGAESNMLDLTDPVRSSVKPDGQKPLGIARNQVPGSLDELKASLSARGIDTVNATEGDWERASLKAVAMLRNMDLGVEDVTPKEFDEIRNAWVYTDKALFAAPRKEERQAAIAGSIRQAMGHIIESLELRLRQATPDEQGRIATPLSDFQVREHGEVLSAAQLMFEQADNEAFQTEWMKDVRWAEWKLYRKERATGDARIIEDDFHKLVDAYTDPGDPPVLAPSDAPFKNYTIRSLLKWGLDNTPALNEELTYLKSTFVNEVMRRRLEALGVTEQGATPYQLFTAVNPKIITKLADLRVDKKARGDGASVANPNATPEERLAQYQKSYLSYAPRVLEETIFLGMFLPPDATAFEVDNIGNQNPYTSITNTILEGGNWLREDVGDLLKPGPKFMREFYLATDRKLRKSFNIADRALQREMSLSQQGFEGDAAGMALAGVEMNAGERQAWLREEDRIGYAAMLSLMPELGDDAIRIAKAYGLPEEFVRQEYLTKGRDVVANSYMTGYSEEAAGELLQRFANQSFLGGRNPSFAGQIRTTWAALPVLLGAEIKRQVGNILLDPEEAAKDIVLGMAGGAGAEYLGVNATLGAPARILKNTFAQRRLRRMYAWAATVDGEAALKLRRLANDAVARGQAPARALDNLNTALHKVARLHEEAGLPGNDFVKVSGPYQELQRALRDFGPALQDMAKPYGIPGVVRKWHLEPSLRNLVAEGAETLKDALGVQNRGIPPWLARSSRNIATEIRGAIDEGVVLSAVDLPAGVAAGQLTTKLASGRARLVEWATRFQEGFAQLAAMNSRRRLYQKDFLTYLDTQLSGEIADLEGASEFLGLDPATQEATRIVFDQRRRVRNVAKALKGREWATPARLSQLMDMDSRGREVLHWAQSTLDEFELYKTLRKPGEDIDQTLARLADVAAKGDPDQVLETARPIMREFLDSPGVRKKKIYFEGEGAERVVLSQERVRKISSERKELARAVREAREARIAARQPDRPPEAVIEAAEAQQLVDRMKELGYGATKLSDVPVLEANLPQEWQRILNAVKAETNLKGLPIELEGQLDNLNGRIAAATGKEKAQLIKERREVERILNNTEGNLAELQIRSLDLHDGSTGMQVRALENASKSLRDNIISVAERNRILLQSILSEGDTARKAYSAALKAQDDLGLILPLEKLRNHAPGRFIGIPADKDAMVQMVLDQSQNLRESLLAMMVDSGIITDRARLDLIRAYAPSLKGVFEAQKLIGGGPADETVGFTSLRRPSLDHFELRRHPRMHTATISMRDGGFVTRNFVTSDDARRFLVEHGVDPEDIPLTAETWKGRTRLGDSARIAAPLGEDVAEALMPIAPGIGMHARLEQLLTDLSFRKFQNMLAREFSDWVITTEQRNAMKQQGATVRDLNQYVYVDKSRRLGPLSERWVHKDVLNAYRRFTDSHLLMKDLANEMRELNSSIDLVSRVLTRGTAGLETAGSATNDAIVSNMIASRLPTVANNLLGDAWMYVLPHTPGVLLDPKGWSMIFESVGDVLAPVFGKAERINEEILTLKRIGVLDDTLADVAQPRTIRGPIIEALFGKDPRHYFKKVFGIDEEANPQLTALQESAAKLRTFIDSPDFAKLSPQKQSRLLNAAVTMEEKVRKRLPKTMMGTSRKAIVDLFTKLGLGRPGGSFDEIPRIAREIYGALNNVLRVAVFRYRTRVLGESTDEALHVVRNGMQTYSRAPTFTRRLARSIPGAPVISYRYEHLRILMWNLANNFSGLAGAWSALLATNTLGMATAGMDPDAYAKLIESDDPSTPAAASLATRLIVPNGDGVASFSFPGMDFTGLFTQESPLLRQLAEEDLRGKDAMGALSLMARNYLTGYFGGNPVVTMAYAALTGRSSRTGQYATNYPKHLLNELWHNGVRIMLPSMFPGGEITQDAIDVVKRPARKLTGRRVSMANAMIQKLVALRIRGANVPGADKIARLAELWTFGQVPTRNIPEEPYNEDDLVASIYFQSAAMDPAGDDPMVTIRSNLDARIRSAAYWQQSEDPEEQSFGNRWMGELMQEYQQLSRDEREIELGNLPQGELEKKLASILRGGHREEYFANMSVTRKADVIRKIHALTGNDGLVYQHVLGMMLTDKFGMAGPTNPDDIRGGIKLLQNYLENPARAKGVENLQMAIAFLRSVEASAEIEQIKQGYTDPDRIQARALLEKAQAK